MNDIKIKDKYTVKKIPYDDTKPFILGMHYAQRMPSVSYSFGLFDNNVMVGVITYGKPASHQLCIGVCGEEHKDKVFELNRLITIDGLEHNVLSFFVAKTLRMLRKEDLIIVSYADTGMYHHGYIYQATNFIYTGKTPQRTDIYSGKGKHSRHYGDRDPNIRKVRTAKHRYIYFTGKSRGKLKEALKYPVKEYPKGANKKYKLGTKMKTKVIDRNKGVEWYE